MGTTVKVRRGNVGGSRAMTIPKALAELYSVNIGDEFDITIEKNKLVLRQK